MCVASAPCGAAASSSPAPDSASDAAQARGKLTEAFDQVWTTIRDRVPPPERAGADWEAVGRRYRERVAGLESAGELRDLLREMLAELDRSHLAILPGEAASAVTTGSTNGGRASGSAGFRVKVLKGRAVVFAVDPQGPAAEAGVRPGWLVRRVRGRPLSPWLKRIGESFGSSSLRELRLEEAVRARLAGEPGETVRIGFLDGDERERELTIRLGKARGEMARFGRLPPTPVWVSFERRSGPIGVLAFNAFLDPGRLMPAFESAVESCRDCRGMIVDLRGNRGGIAAMAMGLAGWFVGEQGHHLGTMTTVEGEIRFAVFPRPEPFEGPLALLVDGATASTAEILAGGLQDLERARLFGSRTAGAALPSVIHRLPTGDGFQFPVASYRSASGAQLEGEGVVPDEVVVPARQDLLSGSDPALEAAAAWIHSVDDRPDASGPAKETPP